MNEQHSSMIKGGFYTILCLFAGIGIITVAQLVGATSIQIVAIQPKEFTSTVVPADGESFSMNGPYSPVPAPAKKEKGK